jgi:hypothetical protein
VTVLCIEMAKSAYGLLPLAREGLQGLSDYLAGRDSAITNAGSMTWSFTGLNKSMWEGHTRVLLSPHTRKSPGEVGRAAVGSDRRPVLSCAVRSDGRTADWCRSVVVIRGRGRAIGVAGGYLDLAGEIAVAVVIEVATNGRWSEDHEGGRDRPSFAAPRAWRLPAARSARAQGYGRADGR